jgi:hypothetical protein
MFMNYLQAICKNWVSSMSGLASVLLAFAPVLFPQTAIHWKALLWTAAVLCFMFANFWVWRSTQPILGIEIASANLGVGILKSESLENSYLTLGFRFCAKSGDLALKDIWCAVILDGLPYAGELVPCRTNEE